MSQPKYLSRSVRFIKCMYVYLWCLIIPIVRGFKAAGVARESSLTILSSVKGGVIEVIENKGKMHKVYDELAEEICSRHSDRLLDPRSPQYWIAVAGGPGAGKSTLTENLRAKINEKIGKEVSCVIPMDGYHYSRSELKAMGDDESSEYTYEELLKRRGSPWTFNSKLLIEDLRRVKSACAGSLPIYCRKLSDPVPDGVELKGSHKIVLVEGNYLLNYKDCEWSPLEPLFDEKWYLTCESLNEQRERLINRHLETWSDEKTRQFGAGREGAALKADSNDMKNAIIIEQNSREYADKIIISLNDEEGR